MQRQTLEDINSKTFLPFEETFLSEELLRKAHIELNETEDNRKKSLHDLRRLISNEKDFQYNTDEKFLLRFLRARKFDTNRAFNLLKNFYSEIFAKYPDLYKGLKPSDALVVLDTNMYGFLPYRNAAGCVVCVFRWGMWDKNKFTFEDIHRCSALGMEKILENEITQICGYVAINDFKNFSFQKPWKDVTPRQLYKLLNGLQNCLPVRVKELHMINHPKILSVLYLLIKPFLSEKISKRVIFHGNSMESLHRYVDPSILPEEFGGQLGPFDNSSFTKMLLESEHTLLIFRDFTS